MNKARDTSRRRIAISKLPALDEKVDITVRTEYGAFGQAEAGNGATLTLLNGSHPGPALEQLSMPDQID